jgi:diguanylate cyclase (GGDEF)-like protein/PAS domain S-box-containing protein
MFRKAMPSAQRDGPPGGKDAFSGLRSIVRRIADVRLEDARVHAELLRAVYAAAPAALTANLVNGTLIVLVFWSVVPTRLLIGWYALLCAAIGIRAWLWRRHGRERPPPEQAARAGRLAAIGSGASGTLWGAAGAVFLVPDSPIHEILLAFVLGGMGAGATVTLAAYLPAFLAYLVPSVLPFALRLAMVGDAEHLAMSGMVLLYVGALLLVGWRTHVSWAGTIAARFANADLVRVAAIVDSSFDAIISMTPDLRITSWNAAASAMYGYAAHEVSGRSIEIIVPPERLGERAAPAGRARRAVRYGAHHQGRSTDAGRAPPVADQGFKGHGEFSGIGRDITERSRIEERTRYLALHDSLTGLPNRTLFLDRLQHTLAEARRYDRRAGLLLLDLDQFKDINDMLGHTAGDQLLVEVARRLEACVRASDTVARLGGDEFALILTEMRRPEDAAAVAHKVKQVMAKPVRLDGQEMHATTSIGIAIGPADGEDPSQLLRAADMALYRAKAEGRNGFRFYAAEMSAQVEARKALECDLRRALERSELTLEFQPQFEFAAARIVGAEALVRWRHPALGLVPPAEFIPLAEGSGLIVPLGAWVLHEACRQARSWRDAGLPHLPTAVNLSLAQCRNGDLASSTRRVLQASGLEPCALELEVTESLFLSPSSGHLNDLYQLHTQGVRVSIDDFGTGYSSLGAAATASRRWARAQSGCRGNRVCSDQAGPFARPTGCGRRRGNSRTMHIPSGGGLQRGAGFPHRPAVAAGRFRGSTRRSPLSDGAARPECARRCRAPAVPAGGPGSRSSSRYSRRRQSHCPRCTRRRQASAPSATPARAL